MRGVGGVIMREYCYLGALPGQIQQIIIDNN